MKAYGLPRDICLAWPDGFDGITYALKSSILNERRKGGDYKNSAHNSRSKRLVRIRWKRRARTLAKEELRDLLQKDE